VLAVLIAALTLHDYLATLIVHHRRDKGPVDRKHLQSYLDEFVFRFNRRRNRHAAFRSRLGLS